MKAKKVLKMLKTKIDLMPEGCNYVIRTNDIEAINKALTIPNVMRFYLVSYHGEGSGSIWFNYDGFPSSVWIKKQIINKFPDVKTPAIMHIQELNEKDFNAFNCA